MNDKKQTKYHQINDGLVLKPNENTPEKTTIKQEQRVISHSQLDEFLTSDYDVPKQQQNPIIAAKGVDDNVSAQTSDVNNLTASYQVFESSFSCHEPTVACCDGFEHLIIPLEHKKNTHVNTKVGDIAHSNCTVQVQTIVQLLNQNPQSNIKLSDTAFTPKQVNAVETIEKIPVFPSKAFELDPHPVVFELAPVKASNTRENINQFDANVTQNTKKIDSISERLNTNSLNEKETESEIELVDHLFEKTTILGTNSESLVQSKLNKTAIECTGPFGVSFIEKQSAIEENALNLRKLPAESKFITSIDNEFRQKEPLTYHSSLIEYALATINNVKKVIPTASKRIEVNDIQNINRVLEAERVSVLNPIGISDSRSNFDSSMRNDIAFSKDVNDLLHNNQLNITVKDERPATIHWAHASQKVMPSLEGALENLSDSINEVASSVSLQSTPHSLPSVEQVFRAQLNSIDQFHIVENFKSHFAQIDEAILKQSPSLSISLESQYLQGGKVQIDIEQGRLTIHFDVSSSHVLAQLTQSLPDLKLVLNERYPQFNTQFSMNDSDQQRQHQEERDEQTEGEQS
ncbi:hypothetical protein [Pseudoalteromonas piratica]|nr:hypothetical protein [Pseudoalteromonas piratica]